MDLLHQKAIEILTKTINREPTDTEKANVLTDTIIMGQATLYFVNGNTESINELSVKGSLSASLHTPLSN